MVGLMLVALPFVMLQRIYQPYNVTTQIDSEVLFVKMAGVYQGEADVRFYFTRASLSAASTFVGDPVLMGHDWVNPSAAVGVVTQADVKFDEKNKTYYIEMICEIKDPYAIQQIKKGLFNKLSIGFSIDSMICSLDYKDMTQCPHQNGHYYNMNGIQVIARGIVVKMTGQEISFVNVPASPNARVLEWSLTPFPTSK